MESRIVRYCADIGMTPDEFKDEIHNIYASMVDMDLEFSGCDSGEQITTFPDHEIIITFERRYA